MELCGPHNVHGISTVSYCLPLLSIHTILYAAHFPHADDIVDTTAQCQ